MKSSVSWIAAAMLALLFSHNVYRAATQSITHDEALTYQYYVSQPFARIVETYDANNHVLHTILCKASVQLLGLSELSMRIPSLLGGLLYFVVLFRLSRYVFGASIWFLASIAFLSLNPLILDFLSAARGYGMALAFLLLALYQAVRYMSGGGAPAVLNSGVSMGLSLASNLTFAIPTAGLSAMVVWFLWRNGRLRPDLARFTIPPAVISLLLLGRPLSHAGRVNFYTGASTLFDGFLGVLAASLAHSPFRGLMIRLMYHLFPPIAGFVAALSLLIIGMTALLAWKSRDRAEPEMRLLVILGGVNLISLVLLLLGHYALRLPYPADRTALYWIPLLGFSGVLVTIRLRSKIVSALALVILGAFILQFAGQLNTSWYSVWRFDASTKKAVDMIRERHAVTPDQTVRIGATWPLEPSLNFYRDRYRLSWMQPVTRKGPEGEFDYYMLLYDDRSLVQRYRLSPILEDSLSGLVVAGR
jgi:4-amino-4-deoxy-L-arabinose transferase-like glycosyltransferase